MALYTIADLHLSLGPADKPMDVFGGRWIGYMDKLRKNLEKIRPEDTTVIPGDLSWAMSLPDAYEDFRFIQEIPGRKIILKGNHDYWWSTARAFELFCQAHHFDRIHVLNNNCFFYGDIALCGTRGWMYDEQKPSGHDEKIFLRELGRLETSLKAAGDREKYCFLHYPPVYEGYTCRPVMELMKQYGVTRCYFGHLHAESLRLARQQVLDGIEYRLVSADQLDFDPIRLDENFF